MLDINECKTFYKRRENDVMFVVPKNKTKQKQISNIASLFYVDLNGMDFVI